MTLRELKEAVDLAIEKAAEFGESIDEITVSVQIDRTSYSGCHVGAVFTDKDLEVCYDGNATASGCVIIGVSR